MGSSGLFIWKEKTLTWNGASLYEVANPHICWSLAQSQLPLLRPLTHPGTYPLPPLPANTCNNYIQTTLACPYLLLSGTLTTGDGGDETIKAGCSRHSRRGLVQEDKRTVFAYTHGLFIT